MSDCSQRRQLGRHTQDSSLCTTQLRVKTERTQNSSLPLLFRPFPGLLPADLSKRMAEIDTLINAHHVQRAVDMSRSLIALCKEGMRYYHTYHRLPLKVAVTAGFVGWLACVLVQSSPTQYYWYSSVGPMCGCGGRVPYCLARDGNQSPAAFEGDSTPGGCGGGFGGPCRELLLSGGALCCPCGCLHLAVSLWDTRIITASSDSPELVPDSRGGGSLSYLRELGGGAKLNKHNYIHDHMNFVTQHQENYSTTKVHRKKFHNPSLGFLRWFLTKSHPGIERIS